MATIQDVVKVVNTCAHRHSDSFLVVRCDGTLFLRERSCVFFVDRIVMWLRRENSSYTKIVDVIAQKILTTDDVKEVDLCNLTAFQKEFNKYQNKKPKDEKTNEKVKDANAKLEKYVLELQKRVLKEDVRIRLNSTINNSEQQKLLSTEYDWLERGQKNESAYEVVAQLVEEHGFQSCQFDEAMKKIHYLVISRSVLYGVIPDVERQYLSLQYDWRKEGKANRDAYQSFAAYLEQNEFLKRPERGDSATRTPAIDVVGHEAHHICCLVKAQYLLSINELLISHLSNKCDWLGDGSSDKDAYEVLATYLSTSRSEREIESVITQIYNMARARYFLQARILSDLIDKLNDRYDWLGDGNSDKNAYEALATYLSTSRSESESEIESVITQIYNMARVRYLLCSNIQTSLVKKLNDRCDWLGDGSSDKNAYEAFFKYLSKPHDNDKAIIERIQNMARARNYLHRVCFTCMDELNDEYDWLGDGNSDKNAYEIIVGVTGQRLQDVKHKIENVAKARHELHIIIDDASLRSQLICKYRWVEGGEKTDAYQAFAMWQDCQGTQIRDQVKKNIVDLASARKCLLQGIGKYKKELDFLYDWFGKGKRTDAYKALVERGLKRKGFSRNNMQIIQGLAKLLHHVPELVCKDGYDIPVSQLKKILCQKCDWNNLGHEHYDAYQFYVYNLGNPNTIDIIREKAEKIKMLRKMSYQYYLLDAKRDWLNRGKKSNAYTAFFYGDGKESPNEKKKGLVAMFSSSRYYNTILYKLRENEEEQAQETGA